MAQHEISRRGALGVLVVTPVWILAAQAGEGEMDTRLAEAAARGDVGEVEALVAAGVPIDGRDGARRTPLLIATRANHVEIARLLIAAGADVNAKDNIRDTPFLYAGAEGRNEILTMILATGRANLADTNRYGGTVLIPAAHHGHPDTVRILLATAIDIDHVNNLGWTALLEAVILGDGGPVYREIVGLLVDAGAQGIADDDGVTPLEHARRRGFLEIAKLIEEGPRSAQSGR
ncbi:hypothetical protein RHIZO_03133 [Rhizobiaceae bacterium]|nr:hypothetical protein RHIZO_03133 [Rhizobiaceae bacterium]